jgi:hypothetical protein
MEKPCTSSWIGAHEKFQAREYYVEASPTSSEPAWKRRTAGQASTNFEFLLELMHEHKCENLMKHTCIM